MPDRITNTILTATGPAFRCGSLPRFSSPNHPQEFCANYLLHRVSSTVGCSPRACFPYLNLKRSQGA